MTAFLSRFAALVVCGGIGAAALAQEAGRTAADPTGRNLASTCTQCHGSAGRMPEGSSVPGLAGLPAGSLVEQMQAFRIGARPATVMHQIAKGYSDAQIARLAAYFAAQSKAAP